MRSGPFVPLDGAARARTRGGPHAVRLRGDRGFAMAALLVAMSIMAVVMGAALPVWQTEARREKEAELIFRGEQYARAIGAFQRKYGNANPPSIDVLLKERFLRRKYIDPITGEDFALVTPTTELPGRTSPAGLPQRGGGSRTDARGSSSSVGSRSSPSASNSGRSTSGASQSGGRGSLGSPTGGRSALGQTGQRGSTSSSFSRQGTQAGATTGIIGVMSKSKAKSLRVYNGADHYNEWLFIARQSSNRAGAPSGAQTPGAATPETQQPPGSRGMGSRGTPPSSSRGARSSFGSSFPQRGR